MKELIDKINTYLYISFYKCYNNTRKGIIVI